jgi:ABC-type branched-subunit amino acid transport system permease subunit/ABC-type uncharacterized transport system YnjBCD ATPase subunit
VTATVEILRQTRDALADGLREATTAWGRRSSLAVAVVVLAALVPVLPLDLGLDRLAADLYLGAAAVALGVAVGLGGMPSIGHGAFVAVGAFGAALLGARAGWPTGPAVVTGAFVAAAAGAAIGLATARLRPALVAVATWLLAWLVALALVAFPSVSGGAQGIALGGGGLSATVHYELAVVLAAAFVLAYVALARSPAGIALSAARERRAAAETLGVPVARLRCGAFAASAGAAGLAGALAVYLAGVADAASYGPLLSFKLFVAVVLGGAVSPAGGLVGVAVLAALARLTEAGSLEGLQASRVETLLAAVIVLSALGATDRGLVPAVTDWARRRGRVQPQREARAATRETAARPHEPPASLSTHGLTKRFGAITALEDVGLELESGTVHTLIGPNGSGKTTALRLLSGTLLPDAGTVVVDGEDISREPVGPRTERGIVGTLQATAVFSELTSLENALVGARLRVRHNGAVRSVFVTPKARAGTREARRAALAALERVGLEGAAHVRAGELPGARPRGGPRDRHRHARRGHRPRGGPARLPRWPPSLDWRACCARRSSPPRRSPSRPAAAPIRRATGRNG